MRVVYRVLRSLITEIKFLLGFCKNISLIFVDVGIFYLPDHHFAIVSCVDPVFNHINFCHLS